MLCFCILPDGCYVRESRSNAPCHQIKSIRISQGEMLQLWGVSLRILHGLSFPLGKHVFMHHPTLSLFRPSDHPPGGLQRRTPNRNCLYRVLLLRQGLLLLAERPSSLHERCLYTILLAPHYRSYERLDSQFRPHTLSFSKTIQSAPGPMFTRLTASACCKPKLRFSNIIHTFAVYGFQQWEIGDSHDVDKSTTEYLFIYG